jgi:excinuclease UvrABC helicase subunit UvrB
VSDGYTAKKSKIKDELDALRHLATRALVQRRDVAIVSSVSCIYGMGIEATSKPNASTIRELENYVHKICTRGLGLGLND